MHVLLNVLVLEHLGDVFVEELGDCFHFLSILEIALQVVVFDGEVVEENVEVSFVDEGLQLYLEVLVVGHLVVGEVLLSDLLFVDVELLVVFVLQFQFIWEVYLVDGNVQQVGHFLLLEGVFVLYESASVLL